MPDQPTSPSQSDEESTFGWRRVAEFLKDILRIERSISHLESETETLRQRVDDLQRTVDDHNGQLKAILSTLNSTLDRAVESKAERIAFETVVRLLEKPKGD